MARESRSEAWLSQLMAKGYGVREQFKSREIIDTLAELKPGAHVATIAKDGTDSKAPGVARSGLVPRETDILASVLQLLQLHPAVAWAERMNTGGMENSAGQYVRFGFAGMSDVLGQLRDGRFLAVEVKRPGKDATPDQAAFIERVLRAHGVAFVAHSIDDVNRELRRFV